jgi:4-hydroxythreonine-4-phosphate dehydrogenase
MKNKPIIIIAGDPNSIFFEIFFKAYKKKRYNSSIILICCKKLFFDQSKFFRFKKKFEIIEPDQIQNKKNYYNHLNIININFTKNSPKYNKSKTTIDYLNKCFKVAFQLNSMGVSNKIINGPINKKNFLKKNFFGITEYISGHFKKKKTGMLIYNKKLSVCPLTTHIPVKLIPKYITKKLISNKIEMIDLFFKKYFNKKPKIAVTGLNPHCESISKFNEDEKIIPPVIKKKIKKGINVKGPFPADTIFLKENRKKFDVIIGMYHDQVLGPLKTLIEYDAINITMGLPIIRVSPDHGPNTLMFKKNKSNPLSLIRALEFLDKK